MGRFTQVIVLLCIASTAACRPCAEEDPRPDTKRFGASTPGGSGGRVIRVTSLDADGPGSLRDALRQSGPRIVVFEVGVVIDPAGPHNRQPGRSGGYPEYASVTRVLDIPEHGVDEWLDGFAGEVETPKLDIPGSAPRG